MTIRREFLDWRSPALPAAAAWLIDRAAPKNEDGLLWSSPGHANVCDLQRTLCILPGRRAGRLLLGQLLAQCRSRGVELVPPTVVTPGAMIEVILQPQQHVGRPIANAIEVELGWLAALLNSPESLTGLLRKLPAHDDLASWRSFASTIADLHAELAGFRIGFEQVAQTVDRMSGEGERWRSLQRIHTAYVDELARAGLADPHQAREDALKIVRQHTGEPFDHTVLVGIVELSPLQRAVLDVLRSADVSALVHAPKSAQTCFDSLGCIHTQSWIDRRIDLDDQAIIIAERPEDQAQHALRTIASFNGRYSAGEITIGLGDSSLASSLQHAGDWAGLPLRSAESNMLADAAPTRALQALAPWIEDQRFTHLADLVRHPDIERWLERCVRKAGEGIANWRSVLDRYFAETLQRQFTGEWLGDDKHRKPMAAIYKAVCELVANLSGKPRLRPIGQWAQPIVDVLNHLYAGNDATRRPAHREACERICEMLSALAEAPAGLQPSLTASQAIRLVIDHLAREPLPEEVESNQIEMLGWLELHLDTAPALIVTGLSEGFVPQSSTADPFLPDSLRQALGLPCNATRLARDAYLFCAMQASRKHFKIIAGRQSARGEPLTPSRLLLQCDDQTLVQRVKSFCAERSQRPISQLIGLQPGSHGSQFKVPRLPLPLPLREYMTITEFKDYLACPYRYALARLLRLEACEGEASELDPLSFGNLTHDVLCAFGSDGSINRSNSVPEIERYLIDCLRNQVLNQFGSQLLPAVRVQVARLEQRLRSFAKLQAELSGDGWRIRHCELQFEKDISLEIPGEPAMPLWGKIDRIDQHERSGQWRIIDYKTGDSGDSPCRTHHNCEAIDADAAELRWHDLQLPLYHYLATRSSHGIQGEIELAYICLPKQADSAAMKVAEWQQQHLDDALETAREVVRNIRAQKFDINPEFENPFDVYARICQTTTYAELEPAEVEA